MAWVRIDDAFYDHPKFVPLTAGAVGLWVIGLAYCNRNLTDGFIHRMAVPRLLPDDAAVIFGHVDELLAASAWESVDEGYRVVNYLEFQPSAAEIRAQREAARDRMARRRSRGSSAEVRANIGGSSATPTPTPTPKKNEEHSVTADAATPSVVDEFDEFWSIYPRKVGKRAARAAWEKVTCIVPDEVVIAGARRYRDDPNREDAFTAHPTTWLNQGRWDDDPLPPRIGTTPTTDPLATARAWAASEESA